MVTESPLNGSFKETSINRLACLVRHWTWTNEARRRSECGRSTEWGFDDDPPADHLFGLDYHWCALLCGFAEAAMHDGFLLEAQLDPLRSDLEVCLPELRACRQLLVVIPRRASPDRGAGSR